LVDTSTFSIIQFLLSHTRLTVKVNGNLTDQWFPTESGIAQGDGLSPILFDVYLEAVSRLAKSIPNSIFKVSSGTDMVLDIEYADDYQILDQASKGLDVATLRMMWILRFLE
jgi:hypothetical protein